LHWQSGRTRGRYGGRRLGAERELKKVIHWFRRDLRVSDNVALVEAARQAETVIPVFILEDAFRTGPDVGAARLEFLLRSLDSLANNLAALGYTLIVRRGRSEIELPKLCLETKAEAVFCNRRYEPYAQARDQRVFNALNAIRVGFESFKDAVLWEERDVLTQAGKPFTVFTPYSKAWRSRKVPSPRPKLRRAHGPGPAVASDPVPTDPAELGHAAASSIPPAGERAARDALGRFLRGPILSYAERRDFVALDGTSHLSAHLRCGTIGIRTILGKATAVPAETESQRRGVAMFLNELIWREFYLQILANFPHVSKGSFRPEYDRIDWSGNEDHFRAWCEGRTGHPIVDAAMRCLNATGWMHNRLRMITAMFLTKDLLINWQRGERYFMRQLVDGDLAANNGGWQWSAGTGTDAAPYFRIFNPVTQGEKFDPEGAFVRQWLPELAAVPARWVHQPWRAEDRLRIDYPERVVLHEDQRKQCLAMYQRALAQSKPTAKL
jgi:deoxyribodipyrimidine photo-lyase